MSGVRIVLAATLSVLLVLGAALAPAQAKPPAAGETQIVSVSGSGEIGDGKSSSPSLSADGRYLAFSSFATNLGGSDGANEQVYVRDLTTGVTTLISTGTSGPGNGRSRQPSISDDGGVVAYISTATNLVSQARSGRPQVFIWTRATGITSIASLSNDPVPNPSSGPFIEDVDLSADGDAVVFRANTDNLIRGVDTYPAQVYERDLVSHVTLLASVDKDSKPSSTDAGDPAISGDGSIVTFTSTAALAGFPANGDRQIFRRDMRTGAVDLVSVNRSETAAADGDSASPAISRDGNIIVFSSNGRDLTDQPSIIGGALFARDMHESDTELVSPNAIDGKPTRGALPVISRDNTSIAFLSDATDLIPGHREPSTIWQVYKRSLSSGVTSLVSRATIGVDPADDDETSVPSISGDGTLVAFDSSAKNLVPGIDLRASRQVYVRDTTEVPQVVRIGGPDRFAVSAAVSADTFGPNVPVVYVASGATFPDALSGSAAAGAQHGPVLLVTKDSVPAPVVTELTRLKPKKIIVLGGTSAIGESVMTALSAYSPTIKRIGGADRFEVSASVSASTFGLSGAETPVAYVASGVTFPDALSGSAAAGSAGGPVLLVTKDSIPASVAAELRRLRPGRIVVLGGTEAVGALVQVSLSEIAPTTRIGGPNRFAVSASVSAATFPPGTRTAYIASGTVFPDALSGSAAVIRRVGPVLLVTTDSIPDLIKAELARLKPTRIVVVGGTVAISDAVLHALETYAVPPS
jgi:putative cell wall-binding protein/Tol biopolymer transport system component